MFKNISQVNNFVLRRILTSRRILPSSSVLGNRVYCSNPCPGQKQGGGSDKHTIKFVPYVAPAHLKLQHDYKNMKLKRPMSPHLEIYGPTLPAMTSIGERIAGVVLVGYALLLVGGAIILPNGINSYVYFIQGLGMNGFTIFLLKFLMGFPFTYHYCIGIRFLAWNGGKWIHIKDVYKTAYVAMGLAGALAFLFALR